jgi:hypothetical protein
MSWLNKDKEPILRNSYDLEISKKAAPEDMSQS